MKLKINKACDLSSISVFPPHAHARRLSSPPAGPHASLLRSQPSQQSFSQGLSSQLSQSSLDEFVTNDQILTTQQPENTVNKLSSLPSATYTRQNSQLPISRSSTNPMHKWNPTSAPHHRCQISEDLERRIGMMETSLTRLGMILDSVQSDVMQVNKGTKQVLLEVEGIQQKLVVHDTSTQLMTKRQEEIKASLDGGLKSLSGQLGKDMYEDKFREISLLLSKLPEQIEAYQLKLKNELRNIFVKEMQAMACSVNRLNQKAQVVTVPLEKAMPCRPNQKGQIATVLSQKDAGHCAAPQRKPQPLNNPAVPPEVNVQATQVPKVVVGGWTCVRKEQATSKERVSYKEQKQKGVSSIGQEKECRIIIDSDEEFDGVFSCLINEKEADREKKLIEDAKEESERILRKARRRKRKLCSRINID